jgi:peroxiredoxin/uncharacterized membrane protein YphA (DoxX/SURF4 family)
MMLLVGFLLLVGRLALAAVFGVAGFSKLADRRGSRDSLIELGVPAPLAPFVAVAVPVVEIGVALALIFPQSAAWAAIAAAALLTLFLAGMGWNLATGRRPQCHCFGQLHSAPIGRSTVARTGVLAGIAALAGWQSLAQPELATVWTLPMSATESILLTAIVVLVGVVLAEAWFLLQLTAQHGRVLLRLEALEAARSETVPTATQTALALGLPVGAKAPDFRLPGLHGETLTLGALLAERQALLLVFADPGCGPCLALLPEIGRWQRQYTTRFTVAVVSRGEPDANRAKAHEYGVRRVLLQDNFEVAEAYRFAGTPSAVLIGSDGTIASALAAGADAIKALAAMAAGEPQLIPMLPDPNNGHANGGHNHNHGEVRAGPSLGSPAPELVLPDLDGHPVRLADLRGHATLVLFWNPGCGFCQRMMEDLKHWERQRSVDSPRLLVVSTGSIEANRAMGLVSPIVLDAQSEAMRAFGVGGTPMAVLVNEVGRIASPPVAGADAVLELARAPGDRVAAGHHGSLA